MPIHSGPIAQNIISNTLLDFIDETEDDHHITVTNHPLPSNRVVRVAFIHKRYIIFFLLTLRPSILMFNEIFQDIFQNLARGFLSPQIMFYGINLGAGITTFVSIFILFPLTERITNAKQVSF